MKWDGLAKEECSLARSLAVLGDRWTLLILRDAFLRVRRFEEFDTSNSPQGLPEDYFIAVVEEFFATGNGRRGTIGAAPSILVRATEIIPFAVAWLERKLPKPAS